MAVLCTLGLVASVHPFRSLNLFTACMLYLPSLSHLPLASKRSYKAPHSSAQCALHRLLPYLLWLGRAPHALRASGAAGRAADGLGARDLTTLFLSSTRWKLYTETCATSYIQVMNVIRKRRNENKLKISRETS